MNRRNQIINDHYEAMMFAKSAEQARAAAQQLVKVVLGEETAAQPLEEALRETCRVLRPSHDIREQQRFEAEFIELGMWPTTAQKMAA
jgi:TnpA family transposase